MILTCPRCAARYVVSEDRVGPQGRKVKCTTCGELWLALPEGAVPAEEPVQAEVADEAAEARPESEPEIAAEPEPEPEPEPVLEAAVETEPQIEAEPQPVEPDAQDEPKSVLEPVETELPSTVTDKHYDALRSEFSRSTTVSYRGLRIAIAIPLILFVGATMLLLFHNQIGRVSPEAARIYASMGIPQQ